jgi:hypothetical protein
MKDPSDLRGTSGGDDFIQGMHGMLTATIGRVEVIVTLVKFAYPCPVHSHSSLLLQTAVALDEGANNAKKGKKQ